MGPLGATWRHAGCFCRSKAGRGPAFCSLPRRCEAVRSMVDRGGSVTSGLQRHKAGGLQLCYCCWAGVEPTRSGMVIRQTPTLLRRQGLASCLSRCMAAWPDDPTSKRGQRSYQNAQLQQGNNSGWCSGLSNVARRASCPQAAARQTLETQRSPR
jgi:hypothetical protein